MLTRAFRAIGRRTFNKSIVTVTNAKRFDSEGQMHCMQCEQTSMGVGCVGTGICGKFPETANMMDLLLYANNGLAQYVYNIEDKLDPSLREEMRDHVLQSTFSTLTNVNFSEDRILDYTKKAIDIRERIKPKFREIYPQKQDFEIIQNNPCNYIMESDDNDDLQDDARALAGLDATAAKIGDANCFGLRECAHYGLKGMMAYFAHSEAMHKSSGYTVYSDQERDEVYKTFFGIMNDLCSTSKDLNFWLGVNMLVGATNVKVLELLDKSHNTLYGAQEPTNVSSSPVPGKCILMSGHDILDVKRVLELIEKNKLDINVYTHGELLPAHGYPELHKHPNLVGHFGTAWQNQYQDFKAFPGPIIMTSNCLIPPRPKYKDRLYTTHCVGYDDVKHIDTSNEKELEMVLNHAEQCKGWDDKSVKKFADEKPHLTGFGHQAILSKADVVINAIKSGDLQHIFVIGGCDGSETTRSYFTDLGAATPDNSIILTLGCGKFRLHELDLGTLGGLPRVLDMGQCNDAYGAVVVASALAKALDTDIHSLPLHYAVSWFEQKAVAVFLSLLHLGIKNIRIGPALPAFLTDDVRKYLFDNLGVRQIAMGNEAQECKNMLSEVGK